MWRSLELINIVENLMWFEKYRPSTFDDFLADKKLVVGIQNFIKQSLSGEHVIPHLLFAGAVGTGKTTLAQLIARGLYGDSWTFMAQFFNASDDRRIEFIRSKIKVIAKSQSLEAGKARLIVLDEADGLTTESQDALRSIMEEYSSNCRFILTCNNIHKIIDAILSRCTIVPFAPMKTDTIVNKLKQICENEHIRYNESSLRTIALHFENMRQAINTLQFVAAMGEVNESNVSAVISNTPDFVVDALYTEITDPQKPLDLRLSKIDAFIEEQNDVTMNAERLLYRFTKLALTNGQGVEWKKMVVSKGADYAFYITQGVAPQYILRSFLYLLTEGTKGIL